MSLAVQSGQITVPATETFPESGIRQVLQTISQATFHGLSDLLQPFGFWTG